MSDKFKRVDRLEHIFCRYTLNIGKTWRGNSRGEIIAFRGSYLTVEGKVVCRTNFM